MPDLSTLFTYLQGQFQTNQFFSGAALGGILLGAVSGVVYYLRHIIMRLWARCFVSMSVHSEDPLFKPLLKWVKEQRFDRYSKHYRLRFDNRTNEVIAGPDYGTYFCWWQKRPMTVMVEKEKEGPHSEMQSSFAQTRETITLRYLGFSPKPMETVFEQLRQDMIEKGENFVDVYTAASHGWNHLGHLKRTSAMSVVLKEGLLEQIEHDFQWFLENESWFDERGVPWKRGYLLHGPPGTGKTSIVRYLARKYGKNIHVAKYANDVRSIEEGGMILLEDVDCAGGIPTNRKDVAEPQVIAKGATQPGPVEIFKGTLSDMLNALDGIVPLRGVAIFMTTNNAHELDPALIRPGRVDMKVEIGNATPEQGGRLYTKFFPYVGLTMIRRCETMLEGQSVSPASLQECFFTAKDAEDGLERLRSLVGS